MEIAISQLRPQMIPIVESYYYPDHLMPSAIGNSYGDIYETTLEQSKSSRLNEHEVPPYFE